MRADWEVCAGITPWPVSQVVLIISSSQEASVTVRYDGAVFRNLPFVINVSALLLFELVTPRWQLRTLSLPGNSVSTQVTHGPCWWQWRTSCITQGQGSPTLSGNYVYSLVNLKRLVRVCCGLAQKLIFSSAVGQTKFLVDGGLDRQCTHFYRCTHKMWRKTECYKCEGFRRNWEKIAVIVTRREMNRGGQPVAARQEDQPLNYQNVNLHL